MFSCHMINRILYSCSCIIEFIKLLGKTDKMLGIASHLIFFPNSFNKFNNEHSCKSLYLITISPFKVKKCWIQSQVFKCLKCLKFVKLQPVIDVNA